MDQVAELQQTKLLLQLRRLPMSHVLSRYRLFTVKTGTKEDAMPVCASGLNNRELNGKTAQPH